MVFGEDEVAKYDAEHPPETEGEEVIFQREDLDDDAKKFIAVELKKQGMDLQTDFIERYAALKKEYEAVASTDPEAAARISLEIAENATQGVEMLKKLEATFKADERFNDQHQAFDNYVGGVRGSALAALGATAKARDRMGEEAVAVRKPTTDDEIGNLLAIIYRNQTDAAREAAAKEKAATAPAVEVAEAEPEFDMDFTNETEATTEEAPEEAAAPAEKVATVVPEKKEEPAAAPTAEEVAKVEVPKKKEITLAKIHEELGGPMPRIPTESLETKNNWIKNLKDTFGMGEQAYLDLVTQEKAARKEAEPAATPEPVIEGVAAALKEAPAEVTMPKKETDDAKRKREAREAILAKVQINLGTPDLGLETGSTADMEDLESQLGQEDATVAPSALRGPAEAKGGGEAAEIEQMRLAGGDKNVKTGGAGEERKAKGSTVTTPKKKNVEEITIAQLQMDADSLGKDMARLEKFEAELEKENAKWNSIEDKDSRAALESGAQIGRTMKAMDVINKTITQFKSNYATVEATGANMTNGATVGEYSGKAVMSQYSPATIMEMIKRKETG